MPKSHLEILPEDINGKSNLVLEGQEALLREISEAHAESQPLQNVIGLDLENM